MKNQNTPEEHEEWERERQNERRRRRPTLLAIISILALALSAWSTFSVYANFHGGFPGSQAINITATYSFGSLGQQILSAGSTGNFSLGIFYAGTAASNLRISFNATNPNQFSELGIVGGNAPASTHRDFTVKVNGQEIAPLNGPTGCNNGICYSTVTVNHGQNNFAGTIEVDPSAQISSFVLQWFADQ